MKKIFLAILLLVSTFSTLICEEQNGVASMNLEFSDTVMRVTEIPIGTEVLFKLHAARYHLKKDLVGREEIYKALAESASKSTPVNVLVNGDTKEIIKIIKK
jgi:hypothetical protein